MVDGRMGLCERSEHKSVRRLPKRSERGVGPEEASQEGAEDDELRLYN